MPDVVIENPVINSAFAEPQRHFRFSDDGITNDIVEERRKSTYFMPIPKAKKRGPQLAFETEWTQDRIEQNVHIDRIRQRVALWRNGKYAGVTQTTRRLLDYWKDPDRENRLFFCQIEALETAIYIARYVKNQSLGFAIPYTLDGEERNYYPDFITHINLPGQAEFTLILEVSGAAKRDKAAKVATAKTFWIPAVNNHGALGRWDFLEIKDPWNAAHAIRKHLERSGTWVVERNNE